MIGILQKLAAPSPRCARFPLQSSHCGSLAHRAIFSHLAERQGNPLENHKTTGERWHRTSSPFILPSKIRSISAAERPPHYEKLPRKLASKGVHSRSPFLLYHCRNDVLIESSSLAIRPINVLRPSSMMGDCSCDSASPRHSATI